MHRPTDSVRIVIFDRQAPDRFLVVTEVDDLDNWKLPGGKFEHGEQGIESPEDAADRELMEELGVDGKQVELRAAGTLTNDDGASARYIFAGMIDAAALSPTADIDRLAWFTEATLPDCQNRGHILSAVTMARE